MGRFAILIPRRASMAEVQVGRVRFFINIFNCSNLSGALWLGNNFFLAETMGSLHCCVMFLRSTPLMRNVKENRRNYDEWIIKAWVRLELAGGRADSGVTI